MFTFESAVRTGWYGGGSRSRMNGVVPRSLYSERSRAGTSGNRVCSDGPYQGHLASYLAASSRQRPNTVAEIVIAGAVIRVPPSGDSMEPLTDNSASSP